MTAQLRSELLKLRTTRTTFALALATAVLVLAAVLGESLGRDAFDLRSASSQRDVIGVGGFGLLFAALVGITAVTGEFRHGTIRPTLVFSPRRERVLAAKIVAAALAGLSISALAQGLALVVAYASFRGRGIDLELGGDELSAIVGGTLAAGALWGGIGAGLGALVRSQVGAIVGLLAWVLIAESILFGLAPRYGRFAPGRASDALSGLSDENLLAAAPAGGLLAAYLVAFAALGGASMLRRDVP